MAYSDTYIKFKQELWQDTLLPFCIQTEHHRIFTLTNRTTEKKLHLFTHLQSMRVAQFTHQKKYQRVDKSDKIANIGVVIILIIIALTFLPRVFEGFMAANVWYIICLTLVSVVSACSSLLWFSEKKGWYWAVLRFIGLGASVWYGTGVLYHVYALFVGNNLMSDLIEKTLQERLSVVFGFGFFITLIYERWKANKL